MENYDNSDISSESEFDGVSITESDDDSQDENLEPERDEYYDEYENQAWNPEAQIQTQLKDRQLAQLHDEIKARAKTPDPAYQKLPRSWPFRPFDVRILPEYVVDPIHYFELFWGLDVWNMLVDNTNAYAQYKQARGAHGNADPKARWWKAVTFYEMRIFIALLIYISISGTSHIASY
jgi:Transposase IS4